MSVKEIAHRLVELCRKGDYQTCYTELFSPEVESIEPETADVPYTKGLAGIAEKGKIWADHMEKLHASIIGDPIIGGNFFSFAMKVDYSLIGGHRQKMEEICVYEVKDGKIVKEIFYY